MNHIFKPSLATAIAMTFFFPTVGSAQTAINARGATITVGGRLHAQVATSTVDGAIALDSHLRRVRVYVGIEVNDFFVARIQPDFAGGETAIKDAYVSLKFDPAFTFSIGQLKRASEIFEMVSSTRLSIIERDGHVPGVRACVGVEGPCSFSGLMEELQFSGRDMGVRIEGKSGRFSYMGTVTNGTGENLADENTSKSFAGRTSVALGEGFVVSGFVGAHDFPKASGETGYATTYGADLELGEWTNGVHVQAAIAAGENWTALDAMGDPASFLTSQAVITYYLPLSSARWAGVEPLARISRTDPDTAAADDAAWLITPGLSLYVSGRNKIGTNLDIYSPDAGATELSLRFQVFIYF